MIYPAAQIFKNFANFGRRPGSLRRQVLHLARNYCEPLTRITGPCRLDGRVQRQQIGLFGDGVNLLGHFADLRNFIL